VLSERYSGLEEFVHAITHGLGAVCSMVGMVVLLTLATAGGSMAVLGCCIYGVTLVLMYTASTLYHSVPFAMVRLKRALQTADHCAIFLLIAGTYTPIALITLRATSGLTLLSTIWCLAVVGIIARTVKPKRFRAGRVLLYLAMGWLSVFALPTLFRALSFEGVVLIVCGGLAYTLGVPFYVWHRLRYHHAIWHGFVLLGSGLHFFAVLLHVIPTSS
jgi:hemolysin III